MTEKELIQEVKRHAIKNYNNGGWDYIVECFDDEDIAEIIKGKRSVKAAISAVKRHADILEERRIEVTSEIF
jgi:hypothetical protein